MELGGGVGARRARSQARRLGVRRQRRGWARRNKGAIAAAHPGARPARLPRRRLCSLVHNSRSTNVVESPSRQRAPSDPESELPARLLNGALALRSSADGHRRAARDPKRAYEKSRVEWERVAATGRSVSTVLLVHRALTSGFRAVACVEPLPCGIPPCGIPRGALRGASHGPQPQPQPELRAHGGPSSRGEPQRAEAPLGGRLPRRHAALVAAERAPSSVLRGARPNGGGAPVQPLDERFPVDRLRVARTRKSKLCGLSSGSPGLGKTFYGGEQHAQKRPRYGASLLSRLPFAAFHRTSGHQAARRRRAPAVLHVGPRWAGPSATETAGAPKGGRPRRRSKSRAFLRSCPRTSRSSRSCPR